MARRFGRSLRCGCAALILLAGVGAANPTAVQKDRRVAIIHTPNGVYDTAATALVDKLHTSGRDCKVFEARACDSATLDQLLADVRAYSPDLIACAGSTLTEEALEGVADVPVLYFMTPNALDAPFMESGSPHHGRVAGVAGDVAPEDWVKWIRATRAGSERIAVLCSERSIRTAQALQAAGRREGIEITPVTADGQDFAAAIDMLNAEGVGGVVMLPDSRVYNATNVERLLLWGVRDKHAVWTFAGNVVKAGALAGAYCEPDAVAADAARAVDEILDGKPVEKVGLRYPTRFERAINLRTAHMIDVRVDRRNLDKGIIQYGSD